MNLMAHTSLSSIPGASGAGNATCWPREKFAQRTYDALSGV